MDMLAVAEIAVADIVFREDLYPRLEKIPTLVQQYAADLQVLPPIEINQRNELIDGWHRWTAHRKMEAATIRATVTHTTSDGEVLKLATRRNNKGVRQLTLDDKKDLARRIYSAIPDRERTEASKEELADVLAVSMVTVRRWLARMDKDAKKKRNRTIFERWLACYTQEQIAEAVGCTHKTVSVLLASFVQNGQVTEMYKTAVDDEDDGGTEEEAFDEGEGQIVITRARLAAAEHNDGTDEKGDPHFKPPLYNVWKQQEKTKGSSHFGNSEVRWLDNLLYLYTKPFDVVVDPFAGGGSTIDLCRKRLRRYFVSDRKPIKDREDVRQHDITDGLPKPPQWKDVKLVYLDPPYWWQAKGEYSEDATDLANMPLEQFNETLAGIISGFGKKLSDGAYIALIIQPTQWNAPDRQFTDHVGDMLRRIKLPVAMRYSVPYESQQCNAQMVEWAKANRECLVLSREIIVWRVE
jgi:hypothetical protein